VSAETIKINYTPRRLQQWLHTQFKRFNCLVAHRRFGKTYCVINELIMKALQNNMKNPHYAYIAPTYRQAKIIAWEYIKDFTATIPNVKAFEQDLRIEIRRPHMGDKITIFLLGSESPDSIRGIYLDGAVIDEMGDCDPEIWTKVVRPCLSDRLGWVIFIGTPKGKNAFFDLYKRFKKMQEKYPTEYFSAMLKVSVTKIIPIRELELSKLEMTEDEYNQEYECDFNAAILGAFYSKQMSKAQIEGRITNVPYQQGILVDTFWDLGINDMMSIWFRQKSGKEWHYIDYYENSNEGIPHYVDYIKNLDYIYGKHVLPHDAVARELGTGMTRQETFSKLGLRTIVQKRQNVMDGIEASRKRIELSWFDEKKCERGLECLRSYSREYDTKKGIFRNTPVHDWASHGADSFRLSSLDVRPGDDYAKVHELPRKAQGDYDIFGI